MIKCVLANNPKEAVMAIIDSEIKIKSNQCCINIINCACHACQTGGVHFSTKTYEDYKTVHREITAREDNGLIVVAITEGYNSQYVDKKILKIKKYGIKLNMNLKIYIFQN